MSSEGIRAGARWSDQVATVLAESKVGILVVTPENQRQPWLLFEAGALAKQFDAALVCPYLVRMETEDLEPGPLTQFQIKKATKEGTLELIRTINSQLPDPLPDARLERLFNGAWPTLENVLANLGDAPDAPPPRQTDDMLKEILETVRALRRERTPPKSDGDLILRLLRDPTKTERFKRHAMIDLLEMERAGRPLTAEEVKAGQRFKQAIDKMADESAAAEREKTDVEDEE